MGMFDTIKDELYCPFCGHKNKGFQTKDTGNLLTEWTIDEIREIFDKEDVITIYTRCEKCKKWISINLRVLFMKRDATK